MVWLWLVIIIVSMIVFSLLYSWNQSIVIKKREKLIDSYIFPKSISLKVKEVYPHLTQKELNLVMSTLRDYFHVCNIAGGRMVSMPSQVVDVAWHEFILFTKEYDDFCKKALGRFLHHTPAEAMQKPTLAQTGIKRAWRISCYRAAINYQLATSLPPLFAIDSMLNIENGFKYSLDCTKSHGGEHCANNIRCGSGCSGGGSSSGSSEGGSGCGGGGCGSG